jgi:hypothetical protein
MVLIGLILGRQPAVVVLSPFSHSHRGFSPVRERARGFSLTVLTVCSEPIDVNT